MWCDWPLAGRDLAWDQAPRGTTGDESGEKGGENRRGIKEKKIRRANRSARFARRYFSYLTAFFAFFPHCVAWSQARRDHSNETSSSLW